jgi:biopolymer transport protein ExbD
MSGGGGEVEDEGGSSGSNVFGEDSAPTVQLNLTALMDILSNLLFFLLACFGTTIVMGINATVPVQSSDKSSVADTRQTVTAGVAVGRTGFDVSIVGAAQSQEELDRWRKKIPLRDGNPDVEALTLHLLAIKQNYPKSDTMILTPESGVSYETMVRAMDAARETDLKISGSTRLVALFPTVVVSTVIK